MPPCASSSTPPIRRGREADSVALPPARTDSLRRIRYQRPAARPDTLLLGQQRVPARDPSYPLIPARVINNMLQNVDNYLTLNVGSANGVVPGQGVVAAGGVVGRVKVVSEHYATVTSLLHSQTRIAPKSSATARSAPSSWLGDDPTHALLDNVLRETKLVKGDTVVTSGYNSVFPGRHFHRHHRFVCEGAGQELLDHSGEAGRQFCQPDLRVRGDQPDQSRARHRGGPLGHAAGRRGSVHERPPVPAGAGAALCAVRGRARAAHQPAGAV